QAAAQSSKITLVVPFPPGGSTDALARLLQTNLQNKLGRIVIVENKAGAAGALGAAVVAKNPPDGSSFLLTFDSHAGTPTILDKPSRRRARARAGLPRRHRTLRYRRECRPPLQVVR